MSTGKNTKGYETPNHPYQGERIAEESDLLSRYGLKNKEEFWRAQSELRSMRREARRLLGEAQGDVDVAQEAGAEFVARLRRIGILGDNDVNVYVGGSDTADDFRVAGGAEIFAPGNDATLLTVLGTGDFDATIDGGEMSGVIYAPTGTEGTGETTIVGGGTVYGGIVTGDLTIGNPRGGTVHFDRALIGQQIVPPNRSIVRLTYLHVTENEISIRNV